MAHNKDSHHKILAIGNRKPTVVKIRQNNDNSYQWWGDDGRAYSASSNSLDTVVNYATLAAGLTRQ